MLLFDSFYRELEMIATLEGVGHFLKQLHTPHPLAIRYIYLLIHSLSFFSPHSLSRLALYVYEYLLHIGAQKSAQTFLSEVRHAEMFLPW